MANLWESVSGVYWRTAPLLPNLNWPIDYGSLFTTIIGALAGAGIGAWAAGYISERNKNREQLTKEIRDTNAAIVLALSVTNCGLVLKKQHIIPLKIDYETERNKCLEIIAQITIGKSQTDIAQLRLLELDQISPPISYLQDIVLSRLSTASRALAVVTELNESVCNLNTALKRRNELITKFKNNDLPEGASKEHFYFGLRYANSQTNEEYRDSIIGITHYTNDLIFFGSLLCDDLREHGELLVSSFNKKRLGGETPEINEFDLSGARNEGLIPPSEDYEPWTTGFQKRPPKAKSRRWYVLYKRK
jgi:hypothetical protein